MEDPKTVSESFPGFLEAGDLDGKDRTLVIAHVRGSDSGDKGTDGRPIEKPIVAFKGAKKEWVLNKTNARTIRLLYGNAFAAWEGKKVTLYATTCDAFGKKHTPCIRVRPVNPETGKAPEII
jgi:hypothetical protein